MRVEWMDLAALVPVAALVALAVRAASRRPTPITDADRARALADNNDHYARRAARE
jgi:hypothetical protein